MNIVEVCQRCASGSTVKEQEYDLKMVFPKMKELAYKYEIKYDPDNPVTSDDAQADRVFEAAVEFLSETGAYCKDTQKIVRFTKDEIYESCIKQNRPRCIGGEGQERKEWVPRKPEDSNRPWCHIGSGIYSSSDELAERLIEGYASIPRADSMAIPTIRQYKGADITPSHPFELLGAMENMRIARKATRNVEREGFPVFNVVPAAVTAVGTIAASHPHFGTRPSDGWLVAVYPEFKIRLDSLNKVAFLQQIGANFAGEASALLGGYAGGAEGVAIASAVYSLFTSLIFEATYHLNFPVTLSGAIATTRQMLWALSISTQSVARNHHVPWYNSGYTANGPATENYFYEAAAYILSSVPAGATTGTPFPYAGVKKDGMTPLEARFHTEMVDATTGMTRDTANQMVKELLDKYETSLNSPDEGQTYPECFDLKTNTPNVEYEELYKKVKQNLSAIGIPL